MKDNSISIWGEMMIKDRHYFESLAVFYTLIIIIALLGIGSWISCAFLNNTGAVDLVGLDGRKYDRDGNYGKLKGSLDTGDERMQPYDNIDNGFSDSEKANTYPDNETFGDEAISQGKSGNGEYMTENRFLLKNEDGSYSLQEGNPDAKEKETGERYQYKLIAKNGIINVYSIDENGDSVLFTQTNIPYKLLSENDREMMDAGIYVYTEAALESLLQDFES